MAWSSSMPACPPGVGDSSHASTATMRPNDDILPLGATPPCDRTCAFCVTMRHAGRSHVGEMGVEAASSCPARPRSVRLSAAASCNQGPCRALFLSPPARRQRGAAAMAGDKKWPATRRRPRLPTANPTSPRPAIRRTRRLASLPLPSAAKKARPKARTRPQEIVDRCRKARHDAGPARVDCSVKVWRYASLSSYPDFGPGSCRGTLTSAGSNVRPRDTRNRLSRRRPRLDAGRDNGYVT